MGGAANTGYYMDTLGKYPQDLKGLSSNTTNPPEYGLYYLFSSTNLPISPTRFHQLYNPNTGVGWRGPYLTTGVMLTQASLNALYSSFGGVSGSAGFSSVFNLATLSIPAYVHFNIIGHAQATAIPHALDAWERPIILQIPYDINPANLKPYNFDYARLVSAGPTLSQAAIDTKIQYDSSNSASSIAIGLSQYPDASDRNNDRVLYLKMPDPFPGGNQPCGE